MIFFFLQKHYPVLFRGVNGTVAHEFIIDLRGFKVFIQIILANEPCVDAFQSLTGSWIFFRRPLVLSQRT